MLDLPFVFELARGLALTAGPQVTWTQTSVAVGGISAKTTVVQYGVAVGLLGWK